MKAIKAQGMLNKGFFSINIYKIAIVLVAAVIAGYFGYTKVLANKTDTASAIQTVDVSRSTIVTSTSASGTVKALLSSDLYFRTSGWVNDVLVKVGDKVTKG